MDNSEIYVLELFKQRNITKVAKALHISQPALSSALHTLEGKLGFSLFNRKSTPMTPTPEGEIYYSFLLEKMLLEKQLDAQIADLRRIRDIRMTVGAPSAYISAYILPCVKELLSQSRNTEIRIMEGTVSSLAAEMLNGNMDLFISTTDQLGKDFQLEPFSEENVDLCSSEPIPTAGDGSPDFNALASSVFITLGKHQPLQESIRRYLEQMAFTPTRTIEVDQVASAVKLAMSGCGLCFASTSALIELKSEESLFKVRLPEDCFSRPIYLAYRAKGYLPASVRMLIQIIKQYGGRSNEIH